MNSRQAKAILIQTKHVKPRNPALKEQVERDEEATWHPPIVCSRQVHCTNSIHSHGHTNTMSSSQTWNLRPREDMGVDSSSVVLLGMGRSDHLIEEVTLKPNDLSRTRSVSSIGAGHPEAGPARVWTGGSQTPPQPPHNQLTHFPRAAVLWPSRGQAEILFLQLPLKMDQSPSPHRTSVLSGSRQQV